MTETPSADHKPVPSPDSAAMANRPDQLTVLVFKDNSTPRTFRVPVRWISQFGWLLAAIFLTSAICIGIGVKSLTYRPRTYSDQAAQSRIHELETQLSEANKAAQEKVPAQVQAQAGSTVSTTTATAPLATSSPEVDTGMPVIDPALLSASSPIEARPYLFKALPDETKAPPVQVPIILGSPSARWNGKTLTVRFNLQYVSKTPGGQQGRIVILARGPGMMLTHPTEVLQPVGKDVLIDPNKGEYFSVSRFREARADFGPVSSHDSIKEVEVLILSSGGQLLIHQNIIPGAPIPARTARASSAKASDDTSDDSDSSVSDTSPSDEKGSSDQ